MGDHKSDEYTICDIKANNNKVQHTFTNHRGFTYTTGNKTNYNAFGINVQVSSPLAQLGQVSPRQQE
ncbi:hypothetical protein CS542_03205 [Pedobacter sp. IW39]|nr:hypothetical protein CS542_03205 [Pedobacter sp. IW39]